MAEKTETPAVAPAEVDDRLIELAHALRAESTQEAARRLVQALSVHDPLPYAVSEAFRIMGRADTLAAGLPELNRAYRERHSVSDKEVEAVMYPTTAKSSAPNTPTTPTPEQRDTPPTEACYCNQFVDCPNHPPLRPEQI